MVIAYPNFECGLSEGHISVILVSPFTPFVQPTSLPEDDIAK
jgi:hypothetical protein